MTRERVGMANHGKCRIGTDECFGVRRMRALTDTGFAVVRVRSALRDFKNYRGMREQEGSCMRRRRFLNESPLVS